MCITKLIGEEWFPLNFIGEPFFSRSMSEKLLPTYQLQIHVLGPNNPIQLFRKIKNDHNLIPKMFGCLCFVQFHSTRCGSKSSQMCIYFLGYSPKWKGYNVYHTPTK